MIELKVSSPRSFLIIAFASAKVKAGNLSCKPSNCFAKSSPIISGLVTRNCPNLINVVPIDCSDLESLAPSFSFKLVLLGGEKENESI